MKLKNDLNDILKHYENLTYSDNSFNDEILETGLERKQIRLHRRIERNTSLSKKVKKLKGYRCEACSIKFSEIYGDIGKEFIEAHHMKPISELGIGSFVVDLDNDFAVLCSNCHSMIHRLDNPGNLSVLKKLIRSSRKLR